MEINSTNSTQEPARAVYRRGFALVLVITLILSALTVLGPGQAQKSVAATSPCPYPLTEANRPVAPPAAPDDLATFTDPTAVVEGATNVRVAEKDYIAPFAKLSAQSTKEQVCIEEGSNVQDNTQVVANGGPVNVGRHAIIAHGAMLKGTGGAVSIAHRPACDPGTHMLPPPGPPPETWPTPAERGRQALSNALAEAGAHYDCDEVPAFISFNALNNSHIEDGALLAATGRLVRGVTLRSGYSSLPGKSLNTQAQADNPALGKVRYVNAGDIIFMRGVLHVNECLAKGYTRMYRAIPTSIYGINLDPGQFHGCEFNHSSEAPRTLDRPQWVDPSPDENVRIIGDAHFNDTSENILENISDFTAIRADEGEPFEFGRDVEWEKATTFHALEPSVEDPEVGVNIGDEVEIGERAVIHGGGRRARAGGPDPTPTNILAHSEIEPQAVVFRSFLDEETEVGFKAVLVGYDTKGPGEEIPDRCVKFSDTPRDQCAYFVEW